MATELRPFWSRFLTGLWKGLPLLIFAIIALAVFLRLVGELQP